MSINSKLHLSIWSVFLIKCILVLFAISSFKTWEDTEIALNLLKTGEFKMMHRDIYDYCFQFPLFSFIQFFIFRIGLEISWVAIFQLLISSASAYLLYYIIIYLFDLFDFPQWAKKEKEIIALWSAVAFLIHPAISYYQIVNIHPFTLDLFFPLLVIFLSLKYIKHPDILGIILIGIALGVSILNRTTLLVSIIPFCLMSLKVYPIKKSLAQIFIVLFMAFAVVTPWLIRNYAIYNKIMMTTTTGEIIWKGSIYGSDGGNHLTSGKHYLDVLTGYEKEQIEKMDVLERQNFFVDKYFSILNNDPTQIIKMYFVKLENFWWFRDQLGIDYDKSLRRYLIFYKIGFITILLAAIGGMFLLGKNIFYLISYPLALSLLQSVFYVETRHRMVIEPILIFLTIITIFAVFQKTLLVIKKNR